MMSVASAAEQRVAPHGVHRRRRRVRSLQWSLIKCALVSVGGPAVNASVMRLVQRSTSLPSIDQLTADQLNQRLTYAGFILLAYELVKSMIIEPIKLFYRDTTFGETMPFKSYEQDVASRHRNEFEACLLYLRDFMEAIDSADVLTIQSLRKHRNELAHDLVNRLPTLQVDEYQSLLANVDRTLFKLSNYRAYMEIGADPGFAGIDWATAKGHEYALFDMVRGKLEVLNARIAHA
jgi:hypothetical protein